MTRTIQFLPWLSFFTAISSPAGIGIYWFMNSVLSLGQSVYVKDKLKSEGLDMNQMALDAQKAKEKPQTTANSLTLKEAAEK